MTVSAARRRVSTASNCPKSPSMIHPFSRDKQFLGGYPLIPGRSNEAGSPENFVQFHDREARDLTQASRES